MKLLKVLDVRGTKFAFLGLSVIANIAWGLIFFSGIDWAIATILICSAGWMSP